MKTYLRHRGLNVIDVKELIALEYLDFEGKYKNYTEKHDFCELCYVEKGEVDITLDSEKLRLSEGEIVLIEPDTEHSYSSGKGNKNTAFVVCFSCPMSTLRVIRGAKFSKDPLQVYCMQRIIDECTYTYKMNEREHLELLSSPRFGGQQAIILQLEYLLIGLLRRLSAEKSSNIVFLSRENFYQDLVEIITGYLKSNVKTKLSLNDVCKHFNYSRSFVCKIFKAETEISLISYFNRLKIEEAKRLLTDTGAAINEISELLGFSEAKYFGMVFKKQVGMTPMEYRERHYGDNL